MEMEKLKKSIFKFEKKLPIPPKGKRNMPQNFEMKKFGNIHF
jgi:hypothetical protein